MVMAFSLIPDITSQDLSYCSIPEFLSLSTVDIEGWIICYALEDV